MLGQELRQLLLTRLEQHRQVATIHDLDAEAMCALHQIAEVRVQLGRTTGQVQALEPALLQGAPDGLRDLGTHVHVRASLMRTGIDVAMSTRLIAQLAEVDLQRGQRAGVELGQVGGLQLTVEEVGHGAHMDIESWC